MTNPTLAPQSDEYQQIHNGIVQLLDTARTQTVRSINTIMTATYWEMGRRIVEFEQGGEARAAYGEQLIDRLSQDLSQRYKRGFSASNLWQFKKFYLYFRKRRYVTAGPYGNSIGKSPLNFTNERYCPTTNPPCCSSLHPPSQTFCRSKPYATRSFWNFLT